MDNKSELVRLLDLADLYKKENNFKDAIKCYEEFIKIDKSHSAVFSVLADLYAKTYGDESLDKQTDCWLNLLKIKPDSHLAILSLAFAYEKIGDNKKAKICYEKLISQNPKPKDYFNYGAFLIHSGNFIKGHDYFRERFETEDENLKYPIESPNDIRWDLESDISDKTLLVHYEQGFGDTIMYCRFLPELKNYAKKIIFVVQPELLELIKNSLIISDGIEILSNTGNVKYDLSMALLDAPYVLKTEINSIPLKDKYLEVSKSYLIHDTKKLKIGIAYSGDKNANYNSRNINIKYFEKLKEIENTEIYSFQKEEENKIDGIISLGKDFNDFTDTASALKNMDLVISTDNVILNLAGALGIKTIGLFNKNTNFRWFKTKGENVGWYQSVKPLQVSKQNNWEEILPEIISTVRKYNLK